MIIILMLITKILMVRNFMLTIRIFIKTMGSVLISTISTTSHGVCEPVVGVASVPTFRQRGDDVSFLLFCTLAP